MCISMNTALKTVRSNIRSRVQQSLEETSGLLRLAPCWVPRSFLQPGKRIRLHPDDLYAFGLNRGGIDERWFNSTTHSTNENRTPDEGLGYVSVGTQQCERRRTLRGPSATRLRRVCRDQQPDLEPHSVGCRQRLRAPSANRDTSRVIPDSYFQRNSETPSLSKRTDAGCNNGGGRDGKNGGPGSRDQGGDDDGGDGFLTVGGKNVAAFLKEEQGFVLLAASVAFHQILHHCGKESGLAPWQITALDVGVGVTFVFGLLSATITASAGAIRVALEELEKIAVIVQIFIDKLRHK